MKEMDGTKPKGEDDGRVVQTDQCTKGEIKGITLMRCCVYPWRCWFPPVVFTEAKHWISSSDSAALHHHTDFIKKYDWSVGMHSNESFLHVLHLALRGKGHIWQ